MMDSSTYASPDAVAYLAGIVGPILAVPVAEVLTDTGADYRDEAAIEEAVALLGEVM